MKSHKQDVGLYIYTPVNAAAVSAVVLDKSGTGLLYVLPVPIYPFFIKFIPIYQTCNVFSLRAYVHKSFKNDKCRYVSYGL